ncbi:MAG: TlpA disulfide reductase family protein [Planctomycetota bacterium]
MRPSLLRLAVPFLLVPSLLAQQPGERLPPVALERPTQTEARSFDEFSGRVVLLEFFAHWCQPCAMSVKHLNELEASYGTQGFSVVGVTMDKPEDAEPWIAKTKAGYAYGYDTGGKLHEHFDIQKTGIPFSVLVDPFGTILWSGHPMSLKDGQIERALEGVFATPIWGWPSATRALAQPLARGDLGAARALADTLGADADVARARVAERVTAMGAHFERLCAREDYAEAFAWAARVVKECEGLPLAATVAAREAELRADPEVLRTVALGVRLAELEGRAAKIKDMAQGDALRAEVERLVADCQGRKLERKAKKLLDSIDRAREQRSKKKP